MKNFTLKPIYSEHIHAFSELLLDDVDSLSVFEEKESSFWRLDAYCQDPINSNDFTKKVDHLCSILGHPNVHIECQDLAEIDWVAENQKTFQPLKIGHIFIHSHLYQGKKPDHCLAIQLEAANAFGTGEHETTQGCLTALTYLDIIPQTMLDMGCGTGIIALAAGKLWPDCTIDVADNDPDAVDKAHENAVLNHVDYRHCLVSEGFSHPHLAEQSYDLIAANILLNPLLEMASDLAQKSHRDLILSGFLVKDCNTIIHEYEKFGFKCVQDICDRNSSDYHEQRWSALWLRKQ